MDVVAPGGTEAPGDQGADGNIIAWTWVPSKDMTAETFTVSLAEPNPYAQPWQFVVLKSTSAGPVTPPTYLASSATIPASSSTATLTSPLALTKGQTYWLGITGTGNGVVLGVFSGATASQTVWNAPVSMWGYPAPEDEPALTVTGTCP